MDKDEKLFVDLNDDVEHVGQRVALVVAKTRTIAENVARRVNVLISNQRSPILTIEDAIAAKSYFSTEAGTFVRGDAETALKTGVVVEGVADCGHQYHFYMETQSCVATQSSDKMEITVSTQSPGTVASNVAAVLKVSETKVEAKMDRAGGAYGGKVSKSVSQKVYRRRVRRHAP